MHTVGIMVVKDNVRKRFYNKKMIVVLMVVLVLRRDQTVAVLNEKLPSLTKTAMSL